MNLSKSRQRNRKHFWRFGKLRIEVFHDYPYLYEGNIDYELEYLKTYANSEKGLYLPFMTKVKWLCYDRIPLKDETEEVQTPFIEQNIFW